MLGRTLLIAAALAAPGAASTANTFDVTRFDDPAGAVVTDGLSLRQAVVAANASSEPATITLHKGTYRLALRGDDDTAAAGDLDVAGSVTIEGDSAGGTVIDANRANDRAFDVAADGDLTLRHVTIRGGRARDDGGAIRNTGALTVESSVFRGNRARGSGGAIAGGGGTCALTDVVVVANSAVLDGGGCSFDAGETTTLLRAIVRGNRASGGGGGLRLSGGSTVLQRVTLRGNRSAAGGGMRLDSSGAALLNYVTIARNRAREGGGTSAQTGTVATVHATLVANNSASDWLGGFISRGSNVVGGVTSRVLRARLAANVGALDLR